MSDDDELDLNDCRRPAQFDVIPANTICHPANDDPPRRCRRWRLAEARCRRWLAKGSTANSSSSTGRTPSASCGSGSRCRHHSRDTPKPARSRAIPCKAILESRHAVFARTTPARPRKRRARSPSWSDFDKLRFVARLGVRPPQGRLSRPRTRSGSDHARTAGLEKARTDRSGRLTSAQAAARSSTGDARQRTRSRGRSGRSDAMGEITDKENAWLAKATAAAIAGARKVALTFTGLPMNDAGRQAERSQWGWIVTARDLRLDPDARRAGDRRGSRSGAGRAPHRALTIPCDVAVVASILPSWPTRPAIDWSLPLRPGRKTP